MLCTSCGKNEALIHLTQITNGYKQESHLCSTCAAKAGLGVQQPFAFDFNNLLSNMFSPKKLDTPFVQKCEACGSTLMDISKSGKAGCAHCYEKFFNELSPAISRIHGNVKHCGKVPKNASDKVKKEHLLKKLTQDLQDAVERQEYEKAAEIRDKIKELNKNEGK